MPFCVTPILLTLLTSILATITPVRAQAEPSEVYFGDTHLHTSWSPDAFLFGNRSVDPDTAYRFARGLPATHPGTGARVQIETPLDFLVVSDHAEFMGVIPALFRGDPRVAESEGGKAFLAMAEKEGVGAAFQSLLAQTQAGQIDPALVSPEINRAVWGEIVAAADRHNDPGQFTSFIGWEWSSMPEMANLHRVILLREGGEVARQFIPYSSFESTRPEDLWAWLSATNAAAGAHFLAIPHNSNISLGRMFEAANSDGAPIDADYARRRMRWERIVEATQVKGDSETHAILSPVDEFATYEEFLAQPDSAEVGSYVRSALRRGLEIEQRTGVNPYQFGVIGATDSHTGLATAEEDNFHQKWAIDGTPKAVLDGASGDTMQATDMGAAGLAAVWAEENTRESLFDALSRREVYSTTGPRMRVRFFGGWHFAGADLEAKDLATPGYAKGVPMGGELGEAESGAPSFLVRAAKDPVGANLDRVQIVKGWLDADGRSREKIYDVALSDGRKANWRGKVPPVGNTVDLATARYTNDIGDAELGAFWTDPDFDAQTSAFYYVRVLEIPTPRHTLFDALALGVPHPERLPATIQERAYTSAIWYRP